MKRHDILLAIVFLVAALTSGCADSSGAPAGDSDGEAVEFSEAEAESEADTTAEREEDAQPPVFAYNVPLNPGSPWPKFRRDAAQTGATAWKLTDAGLPLWSYRTGKGIFSSPVVGGDGTIYCGSADRYFYALKADGSLKWRIETGEIIDSAALLDDRGRVYFGSGDGRLYASDAETGDEIWTFEADDPGVNNAFIRWFEGNVAIAADGTLVAGNDNFFIYGLDRDDGTMKWRIKMPDQTWALPAVDVARNRLYVANNNVVDILGNVFAFDMRGEELWRNATMGTIAASPMLLDDLFIVGGYDGYAHAFQVSDGQSRWEFAAKDHIYASAALGGDGGVILAGADGGVYNLDPADGSVRWAFDWGAPLRSSPAVDGDGHIYIGSGDGYLLAINADGSLRWALKLIDDDRDDLNASPALGLHAVYIAGESGEIFGVPYDYCLRATEAANPKCILGPDELLPTSGVELRYTTHFGSPLAEAPEAIEANQALAFTLLVRDGGDTILALIDADSLSVTLDPVSAADVQVSADRRFVTLVPATVFAADTNGVVSMRLSGDYLINPDRSGLATRGGSVGGQFDETFTFTLLPPITTTLPLSPPASFGAPGAAWELRRLAAPYPTLMPSYNQIGFDSLHFIISVVDGADGRYLGWVTEGVPDAGDGATIIDPGSHGVFPVEIAFADGVATIVNQQGFALQVMNVNLSFNTFRISARLKEDGGAAEAGTVYAKTLCSDIPFYGKFLRMLGLCHPDSDMLIAFGGAILEPFAGGVVPPEAEVGLIVADSDGTAITVTVTGSELIAARHNISLLVADRQHKPVNLNYGMGTTVAVNSDGVLTSVNAPYDPTSAPSDVTLYLIVDGYPAWRQDSVLVKPEN